MPRPDLGLAFGPLAPIDPPPARAPGSRPPGVPPMRRKRIPAMRARARPLSEVALEPRLALGVDDFQDLRRQGLFGDDARGLPPSWWTR